MGTVLKQPRRDDVREDELAAYDRVVARQTAYGYTRPGPGYETARSAGEEAGPYFGPLLHSPRIADHLSELGVLYRTRGEEPDSYRHQDREWIDIVLGRELSFHMWGHVADGMAVGVRPEAIIALCEDRDEDLTDDERATADYIKAFARGSITPEQWEWVLQRFGHRGAIEYTAFCGHLLMTIRIIQAVTAGHSDQTGTGAYRLTDADIVQRCREVLAGTRELPDPKARIPQPTSPVDMPD